MMNAKDFGPGTYTDRTLPNYVRLQGQSPHYPATYRVMPSAFIDPTARIGDGILIGHFALVREKVRIGDNCKIGSYTEICPCVDIWDNVWIHSRCFIVDQAQIQSGAFLGPGVILCDARYPRSPDAKNSLDAPIIRGGAIIGAGAIIMPGVVVGAYAIVGAGSVVTKSIPKGAVAYGNPCRVHSRKRPQAYLARPAS